MTTRQSSQNPPRLETPPASTLPLKPRPATGQTPRRVRACLFCGVSFASAGSHERICGPCKERDDWAYGAAVTKGHTAW